MTPQTTPTRLNLKKSERLEVDWQDGRKCVYPISYLRTMCPCAACKISRDGRDPHSLMQPIEEPKPTQPEQPKKRLALSVLPGNYSTPLQATSAELVGNYALRIEWSDGHGSGIYSFDYLREICPP